MGLLDGMLEGVAGAAVFSAVSKLVNDHGGLQGMMDTLSQKGLGGAVQSWIGTGPNQAVTPDQIHQALGADKVAELAHQAGLTPEQMSTHLANTLPHVVDQMTPNGTLPPAPTTPGANPLDAIKHLFG